MTRHVPVLLKESIDLLNPQAGQNFIDCTFGGGGHGREILKHISPDGMLLALDANQDVEEMIKKSDLCQKKNFIFIQDNFKNLKSIISQHFDHPVHGILLDLGLSSDELEISGRGFSFQKDEPLDMRFDIDQELTAADILNFYSLDNLHNIFKNLGHYTHARRLSQIIVEHRKNKKYETTQNLIDDVLSIEPRYGRSRIHPATKVFQALRIAVNLELENLRKVLNQAMEALESGGRLAVISFHEAEDRIVKRYLRTLSRQHPDKFKLLTKKPIIPSFEEVKDNPRSRSAKLRGLEKI